MHYINVHSEVISSSATKDLKFCEIRAMISEWEHFLLDHFNDFAPSYDRVNLIVSLRRNIFWRRDLWRLQRDFRLTFCSTYALAPSLHA